MAAEPTITVTITRRPWWQRLIMFPWVWRGHYRIMRRHHAGRLVSLYGSWVLAGVILKPEFKR